MINFNNTYVKIFSILLTLTAGYLTFKQSHLFNEVPSYSQAKFAAEMLQKHKNSQSMSYSEKVLVNTLASKTDKSSLALHEPHEIQSIKLDDLVVLIDREGGNIQKAVLINKSLSNYNQYLGKVKGDTIQVEQTKYEVLDIIKSKK